MSRAAAWASGMTDGPGFEREQLALMSVWQFLGFAQDIPHVDDWFRTSLGMRSIVVQRFADGIRGFENICPHRFHPIRTQDKGSGPMVCGFHHWRYDDMGKVIDIPNCENVFGRPPHEINVCLTPVEIALCGGLIFGRVGEGPSLQEWLGPAYDVMGFFTRDLTSVGEVVLQVRAHWKLLMQVSLDDYHIVAIHPKTFGKTGFLAQHRVRYYRVGDHSAFIPNGGPDAVEDLAELCRQGRFAPIGYVIFQFFPTLVFVIIRATRLHGDDYWYLITEHMVPVGHDQTRMETRIFELPFTRPAGWLRRLARVVLRPVVNQVFRYYTRKTHGEDNAVCEQIQRVSHQINGNMMLSNQETRIAWFEQAYARWVRREE